MISDYFVDYKYLIIKMVIVMKASFKRLENMNSLFINILGIDLIKEREHINPETIIIYMCIRLDYIILKLIVSFLLFKNALISSFRK